MRNTIILILVLLVVGLGVDEYFDQANEKSMEAQFASILGQKDKENRAIRKELNIKKVELIAVERSQEYYESRADSLTVLLKTPRPLPEVVGLQGEKIENLEGALVRCKEAKEIYTKKLGLTQELVVNNEVIIEEATNLDEVLRRQVRKEKRKTFLKGFATGGLVMGLLIILAL